MSASKPGRRAIVIALGAVSMTLATPVHANVDSGTSATIYLHKKTRTVFVERASIHDERVCTLQVYSPKLRAETKPVDKCLNDLVGDADPTRWGVVVLESITRCREEGDPLVRSVIRGTGEVGTAVVASTLTTVAVFIPIVFVEGVAGQVFGDLSLTVVFSLVTSLIVALFLVPMLASRPFLAAADDLARPGDGEGRHLERVRRLITGPVARIPAPCCSPCWEP